MQRLTLVGYRGCGKITLDSGRSIAAIFAGQGEAAFRALESRALAQALAGTGELVLSTGGGCVLSGENRGILRARGGQVVYLEVPVAVLQRRLRADATARPSLTGRHPADEVAAVLAVRDPLYREVAHAAIDADREPDLIVRELVQRVENPANPSRKPGVA